ncbi:hypothetical protein LRU_01615 [Ligilactobacillus ruminis SPM0211]|uniref:Uncharacterized protein n=1 Tax=Ligilactobacillus ruminis SPM0211 TaxID=1040964 RepID=F7R1P1_9LACO|nr:hypothetical protein LRU_01615 [Ligilactobacillus ruminis SPM0211]EGX98492.1 hypothetical protein ANHS_954 [Ligilactobacillus ruminis ATCC 25644]
MFELKIVKNNYFPGNIPGIFVVFGEIQSVNHLLLTKR